MTDIPNYYDIIREFGVPSEERPPLPQSKRTWFGSKPWEDRHPAWQLAAMHERHRAARTERNMVEEIVRLRAEASAMHRYQDDTLTPKIRQWEIVEAAARRLATAQDNVVRSWLPSEADCAELDAAWADLRVALGMASESA